jgi:serine/threonine protein kinase
MLQAAQRIGDFEIVRLLGKGGMGEVYEAQQLNPPRRVALKVLAPWLAQDEEALRRFEREAGVPAQLDHPGIVRIIVTGRTPDGLAFYTM